MKKFLLLACLLFLFCPTAVKAESFSLTLETSASIGLSNTVVSENSSSSSDEELIEDLEENVASQLDDLDFSSLDEVLKSFTDGQIAIFGGSSFLEKISSLIAGEYNDSSSLWQAVLDCFLSSVLGLLPMISAIIGVSILGSMLQGIRPSTNGKSMANIINFVSYGIVVVLLLSLVSQMLVSTTNTIVSL